MSSAAMLELIERGSQALQRLHELMQVEAERLQQRQPEGLQTVLAEKLEQLQILEGCEQERRALVLAAGADPGSTTGMQSYFETTDEPALQPAWAAFLERLTRVQAQNQASGRIIGRSLSQVERDLALLSGQPLESAADTYGPQGRRPTTRSRKIDRA